jgi:hypothetical protein
MCSVSTARCGQVLGVDDVALLLELAHDLGDVQGVVEDDLLTELLAVFLQVSDPMAGSSLGLPWSHREIWPPCLSRWPESWSRPAGAQSLKGAARGLVELGGDVGHHVAVRKLQKPLEGDGAGGPPAR